MSEKRRRQVADLLLGSALLQGIFDSIQDGILVVDRDRRIVYANLSAERLLGIPLDDLIGTKADELPLSMHYSGGGEIPSESRPFAIAFSENPIGEAQQVILKRSDGSTLPVLFNVHRKGGDLTVAILTDASNLMRRQMQADEYYKLLVHDLRTPLSVILGHTELLQKGSRAPEDLDRSLSTIYDAGEQVKTMTEEMSDRLEMESGHFELRKKKTRLDILIREVVSLLISRESTHNINIKISELPETEVDVYRLKRVLINLIANAMKYSPEKSTITITTWETGKGIMAKISDQGRGIIAEDLHYIFDPFYITKIGKEQGGVGLGLYIARLIMEAHDGRIYVSSTEEGTSFALFLPKTSP